MNLSKQIFIVFSLIIWGRLASQSTDTLNMVHWKDAFEIPRSERIDFFQSNSSHAPVIVSSSNENIYIRPIDPINGVPIKTLAIRSNDSKKIEQYELHGDTLFAFVRTVERSKDDWYEVVLYSMAGDSLKELHRHKVNIREPDPRKNPHSFYFSISPSGKQVLVARQLGFTKATGAKVYVETLSAKLKKLESKTVTFPYDADDFELLETGVDDLGTIYLVAKSGVKLNSPFMRKYLVYSIRVDTKNVHEFDVTKEKVFIQDLSLKLLADRVIVFAFYSSDPFLEDEYMGYSLVQIDSLGSNVELKQVSNFTTQMIASNRSGNEAKYNSIEHLVLDGIYQLNNKTVAIFDKRYKDQICTTDPRTGIMTCTDQFHFQGINVEFTADQSRSFTVMRKQIDYDRVGPYISQQVIQRDRELVIFYNDHYKNTGMEAEKVMNNPSRSVLRFVTIDADQNVNTSVATSQKDGFVFVSTLSGYEQSNGIYLLFSSGREYRIGIIDANML